MIARKGRVLPLTYSFDVPWTPILGSRFGKIASNNKIKNFLVRIVSSESGNRFVGFITSRKRVLKTTFCSWLGCLPNQLIPSSYTHVQFYNMKGSFDWEIVKINNKIENTMYDNLDDIDFQWALATERTQAEDEEDYHNEERRTLAQFIDQSNARLDTLRNKPHTNNKNEQMPRVIYNGYEFGGKIPVTLLLKKLCFDAVIQVREDYWDGDIVLPDVEFDFYRFARDRHWQSVDALKQYIVAFYITIYQKKDVNNWVRKVMEYARNHRAPPN